MYGVSTQTRIIHKEKCHGILFRFENFTLSTQSNMFFFYLFNLEKYLIHAALFLTDSCDLRPKTRNISEFAS